MMKKIRLGAALGIVGILLAAPVLADYSGAQYEGGISIENAGDTVSGVSVFLEMNTESFMDAEYLEDDYSNVWFTNASGNSMAFMPVPAGGGVPSGEWCFFYPWSIPGSGQANAVVYMGGPDMTPPIYYIPGATGMTSSDSATLEPGGDWTAEVKGYMVIPPDNSAAPWNILYKGDAVWVGGMQDGIIAILCSGAATFSQCYSVGSGFSDPDAIWTEEGYAYDNNTANAADLGAVPATSWSGYLNIDLDYAPLLKLAAIQVYAEYDAASWTQYDLDVYYSGAWHDVYEGTYSNLAYDLRWLPGYYEVSDIRIRFYNSAGSAHSETDILREVQLLYHHNNRSILFAEADSGSHTVKMDYANPDVTLYLDGVAEDTRAHPAAAAVNANANDWTFVDDGSFGYVEYLKQWQGAALTQHIVWEDATTFVDLSGNGNDATPSFLAASSDADVTASLVSLEPYGAAEAPEYVIDESTGMISGAPDEPDNLYDEMDVDHIPGAEVLNALLDAGGIPRSLVWFPLTFAFVTFVSIVVYKASRSLFAMSLTAGALLIFASRTGIVPFWVAIPFILLALGILVKERTVSL